MNWHDLQLRLGEELDEGKDILDMEVVKLTMLAGESPEWDKVCQIYKNTIRANRPEWLERVDPITNTDWHHLYHLYLMDDFYLINNNNNIKLIEFGGGFGNMAMLAVKIFDNIDYTILDLPNSLRVQKIYLDGLPVKLVEDTNECYDMLVSTWALSETDVDTQMDVASHWFGADQVMLAYQDDKTHEGFDCSFLQDLQGFKRLSSPLKGNTYAFKLF